MNFISVLGIFMWLWMYLYFCITYELISKSSKKWVRIVFWNCFFKNIWLSPYLIRMISYGVVLTYVISFSLWAPSEVKNEAVLLMFALSCIAVMIDLFLSILKIAIFLSWIWGIYWWTSLFWLKRWREKLLDEGAGPEESESPLQFEEYTIHGSQEGEEDEEEESKDHIGMRRMRIRRKGMLS